MIITALITPFKKNGKVNYKKIKSLLKEQEQSGVEGIILFGSTGETCSLSIFEKLKISYIGSKFKKLKIILNVGNNDTKLTLRNIKLFSIFHPFAYLIVTPYYNNPSDEGMIAHYKKINERTKIPLIIYNVPSRTNYDMPLETIAYLSKLKNIIGIKEASKNIYKLTNIKEIVDKEFLFLLGNDEMFVLKEIKNDGIASVLSNVIPKAFINNDLDEIRKYLELTKLGGNPQVIKEMMNLLGYEVGSFRLPLVELNENKKKEMIKLLGELK